MSLKSIIKAGDAGKALRAIRDEHASFANKIASAGDALPEFLLRGGVEAKVGAPVPTEAALSGGLVPDGAEARAAVAALIALVPVPTEAEWLAATDSVFDEGDCEAACNIIRARAVLRYVAEATGAVLPPNDV